MTIAHDPWFAVPAGVRTRWASPENRAAATGAGGLANGGRKGSPCFALQPGETATLAEVAGTSGTVRRIWATISEPDPKRLRSLRIEMRWDGCQRPAVSAPWGDFFGTGLGQLTPFESAVFANPEGRSFVCYAPMPFRSGMRITVANDGDAAVAMIFYDIDFTVGDRHGPDACWFHAWFNRERPTTLQRDYAILPPVRGRGRFLGANLGVIADTARYDESWWGEGEVKAWIDGDGDAPTLCGTGTEDWIGTAWGQGRFAHLYQGCHVADRERLRYCFYRYHLPDPVLFHESCRIAIQQIGCFGGARQRDRLRDAGGPLYAAAPGLRPLDLSPASTEGYRLFERQDDWSSCAYLYLDRPDNDLPPLMPVSERIAGL